MECAECQTQGLVMHAWMGLEVWAVTVIVCTHTGVITKYECIKPSLELIEFLKYTQYILETGICATEEVKGTTATLSIGSLK